MLIEAATDEKLRSKEGDFMQIQNTDCSWKPNILKGPSLLLHTNSNLPMERGVGPWEMTSRHIFCSSTGSWDQLFTQINRLPFSLVILYLPLSTLYANICKNFTYPVGQCPHQAWSYLHALAQNSSCDTVPTYFRARRHSKMANEEDGFIGSIAGDLNGGGLALTDKALRSMNEVTFVYIVFQTKCCCCKCDINLCKNLQSPGQKFSGCWTFRRFLRQMPYTVYICMYYYCSS